MQTSRPVERSALRKVRQVDRRVNPWGLAALVVLAVTWLGGGALMAVDFTCLPWGEPGPFLHIYVVVLPLLGLSVIGLSVAGLGTARRGSREVLTAVVALALDIPGWFIWWRVFGPDVMRFIRAA